MELENGSVNILESCDFRSQFDPLYQRTRKIKKQRTRELENLRTRELKNQRTRKTKKTAN